MSRIIPIINEDNSSITTIQPVLSISSQNNSSSIIPVINEDKKQVTLIESNLPTLSINKSEDFIPILDDNNDLQLEMNGIGPMGPSGKQGEDGNGISHIEKTNTIGLTDYYTIYFTNGEIFEYQITNGIVHYYDGDYEVTPMAYSAQILPTENMVMRNNLNIREIPYSEVSNLSGGKTVTIGEL